MANPFSTLASAASRNPHLTIDPDKFHLSFLPCRAGPRALVGSAVSIGNYSNCWVSCLW
jgi:hypothetical protein